MSLQNNLWGRGERKLEPMCDLFKPFSCRAEALVHTPRLPATSLAHATPPAHKPLCIQPFQHRRSSTHCRQSTLHFKSNSVNYSDMKSSAAAETCNMWLTHPFSLVPTPAGHKPLWTQPLCTRPLSGASPCAHAALSAHAQPLLCTCAHLCTRPAPPIPGTRPSAAHLAHTPPLPAQCAPPPACRRPKPLRTPCRKHNQGPASLHPLA